LPEAFHCEIKLSSKISVLAKFDPASMKVGRLPVVNPLSRCIVVVGGSEYSSKSIECVGSLELSSAGRLS
jgi:hypothetical protein